MTRLESVSIVYPRTAGYATLQRNSNGKTFPGGIPSPRLCLLVMLPKYLTPALFYFSTFMSFWFNNCLLNVLLWTHLSFLNNNSSIITKSHPQQLESSFAGSRFLNLIFSMGLATSDTSHIQYYKWVEIILAQKDRIATLARLKCSSPCLVAKCRWWGLSPSWNMIIQET